MKKSIFFFILFLCSSCYKQHLYVQQQSVGRENLASTFAQTPDPRQKNPPKGQKIIISWDFPQDLFLQGLIVKLTVCLWDHEQKTFEECITKRRGYVSYFFENPQKKQEKKILTYKVDVLDKKNMVIDSWKHQFWTEMIQFTEEDNM